MTMVLIRVVNDDAGDGDDGVGDGDGGFDDADDDLI